MAVIQSWEDFERVTRPVLVEPRRPSFGASLRRCLHFGLYVWRWVRWVSAGLPLGMAEREFNANTHQNDLILFLVGWPSPLVEPTLPSWGG